MLIIYTTTANHLTYPQDPLPPRAPYPGLHNEYDARISVLKPLCNGRLHGPKM